jgi:hypothetical protein
MTHRVDKGFQQFLVRRIPLIRFSSLVRKIFFQLLALYLLFALSLCEN